MTDLVGKVIGHYRLLELLGQGAMAQVYRARDLDMGGDVAVKVLHPHLTADPEFATRFEREVRAAAGLDHPGIVRILDHGREGGLHYLVMPLIDGPTLKAYLQEREDHTLPIAEAVSLIARLADALDHAHCQGVVHRDVKPSNVLLPSGDPREAVLSDFGVARMVEATVDTASGTTLGTPAYMSPEQGEGKLADARSDVYALGTMLFELVTGQPPFQAESPYAVVLHHVHTPPPRPRSLRPDLPLAVEAVILRALAKSPADRYSSASAFAAALRQSLTQPAQPRSRVPIPSLRSRTGLAVVATLAVVLVGVLMALYAGWLPVSRFGGAVAADATPVVQTLILQGAPAVRGAWLDPDLPERAAAEDPKVHLQGPSTPDRIAYRLVLPEMPPATEVLTATLSLYTVPWGEDNRYATVALHRLLRDWDPATATYGAPWTSPGLQAGVDHEAEPFFTLKLDELLSSEGWLDLDVASAVRDWLTGQTNHGVMLRMTDDSFGMAHLWVYTAEYPDPDLRPRLTIVYRQR
ncbi:MAG: protein kinase [Anaerolineae bacterium]